MRVGESLCIAGFLQNTTQVTRLVAIVHLCVIFISFLSYLSRVEVLLYPLLQERDGKNTKLNSYLYLCVNFSLNHQVMFWWKGIQL
jgi:hypothetical protein